MCFYLIKYDIKRNKTSSESTTDFVEDISFLYYNMVHIIIWYTYICFILFGVLGEWQEDTCMLQAPGQCMCST